MGAGNYCITIEQGADFNLYLTYKDDDGNIIKLTGYGANMVATDRDGNDIFEFTEDNGITLGEETGTIDINILSDATAAYDFETGSYRLNLIQPDQGVIRLLEGSVILSRDISTAEEES